MVAENEEGRNVRFYLKSPKNEGPMVKLNMILEMIENHLLSTVCSTIYISLMVIIIICTSITISTGTLDDNSYGDIIITGISSNSISKTATLASNQDKVKITETQEKASTEVEPSIHRPPVEGATENYDGTSEDGANSADNLKNKNIFVLIISVFVLFVLINKYA